jgi:hypothetical protein
VTDKCVQVIDELLKPEVRSRMLKLGGDPNVLVPIEPKSFANRWGKDQTMWHEWYAIS